MNEIWKDIEGYEGLYQVSNFGRVKSLKRMVNHPKGVQRTVNERIIKSNFDKYGYLQVCLSKNGLKSFRVHRLVCSAFHKNYENKPQVNHKDGIKTNNRPENLEWVFQSENEKHAHNTGLKCFKGEKSLNSKLTEKQARDIKYNYKDLSLTDISNIYNIAKSTVSLIRNGKRWAHI